MSFRLFVEKTSTSYSFSSLQFDLPQFLADKVMDWGQKHIPEKNVFTAENKFGREDNIHLTVLYGIHAQEPHRIVKILRSYPQFNIKLGPISLFTTDERFDVLKIDVKSEDLMKLNKFIRDSIPYSTKHKSYQPHITIAYIKKGTCRDLVGKQPFDQEIEVKNLIFSSKNGSKSKIRLTKSNYLHEAYIGYGLSERPNQWCFNYN